MCFIVRVFILSLLSTIIGFLSYDILAAISRFSFIYPADDDEDQNSLQPASTKTNYTHDKDNDLILKRRARGAIHMEHRCSTNLSLVGLQVWRGALILADFLIDNRKKFAEKNILELGSGVGLTSIAAATFSKRTIVCTDVDIGGILNLIRNNVERNKPLLNRSCTVEVEELNFRNTEWSTEFKEKLRNAEVILAADGKK